MTKEEVDTILIDGSTDDEVHPTLLQKSNNTSTPTKKVQWTTPMYKAQAVRHTLRWEKDLDEMQQFCQ